MAWSEELAESEVAVAAGTVLSTPEPLAAIVESVAAAVPVAAGSLAVVAVSEGNVALGKS